MLEEQKESIIDEINSLRSEAQAGIGKSSNTTSSSKATSTKKRENSVKITCGGRHKKKRTMQPPKTKTGNDNTSNTTKEKRPKQSPKTKTGNDNTSNTTTEPKGYGWFPEVVEKMIVLYINGDLNDGQSWDDWQIVARRCFNEAVSEGVQYNKRFTASRGFIGRVKEIIKDDPRTKKKKNN